MINEKDFIDLHSKYTDKLLDIIERRDEFTTSDLQGCIACLMLRFMRDTEKLLNPTN